ncbi:MAG: enoyl-CoA hydratase/isomerase family protein [SAR202 cluster bacterium]|nr:enoyl-CoA hydratase/isomerase family protein [SAR202 cluster bacterium]
MYGLSSGPSTRQITPKKGARIASDPVLLKRAQQVATVTLDRPNSGNRLDAGVAVSLREVCGLLAQDSDLRLVVLTANGEVFSAGAPEQQDDTGQSLGVASAVAALNTPVLVALNGDAVGAGLELALAGDLRICVSTARFGFPGLAGGILPRDGGTQRLSRLVGPAWARDMLLTGRMVDAKEALSIGLVNRVVDGPEGLIAITKELTEQITAGGPIGARYAKEAVNKGMDMTLDQGLGLEADLNVILQSTSDRAEGLKSFLEKRPPKYDGT